MWITKKQYKFDVRYKEFQEARYLALDKKYKELREEHAKLKNKVQEFCEEMYVKPTVTVSASGGVGLGQATYLGVE